MKRYKLDLSSDPSFNTVTGLSNTTFNPTTTVENRMATEAQIQELYRDIVAAEQRRDYCCRDIIVWEARTQIVRLNTNIINTSSSFGEVIMAGGVVVSSWEENINIGTMRRGLKYNVTFPVKWDKNLYYPITPERNSDSYCERQGYNAGIEGEAFKQNVANVQFRYLEDTDDIYGSYRCVNTLNNRTDYFLGTNSSSDVGSQRTKGYMVNSGTNWGSFTRDVKSDGTVTITDNRRNTNYNIIRFYTQWTLNVCADGSLLSDKENLIYPEGRHDPVW